MTDVMNFDDAPDGGLSLDDIFGDSQPSTTVVAPVVEPQVTPVVTTQPAEPFIKTKTGTVYKTLEDTVEGIQHKDSLIAQLREQVRQQTGNDPLVAPRQATQPVGPKSYVEDQGQYFQDIAEAVEKKDTGAYMRAQQKLIWDSLGPLAPTIISLAKANAERVVCEELPEFRSYHSSERFTQLGQDSPLLAEAIRSAEMNPQQANQLPELYRIAYLSSQGRRVPELLQSARNEPAPVQPRPTIHSTQVSQPAVTGVPVSTPSLDTKEGRQAIIQQMESRGIANQRW